LLAMGTDRTCQLFDFLAQLVKEDPGEAARVAALLDRTAEHGPPKDETKCRFFKSLRLFELKTRGGVRIMAFLEESRLIICSHAFMKKSQKTPDSEKKRAADAKADYVKAKSHNLVRRVD